MAYINENKIEVINRNLSALISVPFVFYWISVASESEFGFLITILFLYLISIPIINWYFLKEESFSKILSETFLSYVWSVVWIAIFGFCAFAIAIILLLTGHIKWGT